MATDDPGKNGNSENKPDPEKSTPEGAPAVVISFGEHSFDIEKEELDAMQEGEFLECVNFLGVRKLPEWILILRTLGWKNNSLRPKWDTAKKAMIKLKKIDLDEAYEKIEMNAQAQADKDRNTRKSIRKSKSTQSVSPSPKKGQKKSSPKPKKKPKKKSFNDTTVYFDAQSEQESEDESENEEKTPKRSFYEQMMRQQQKQHQGQMFPPSPFQQHQDYQSSPTSNPFMNPYGNTFDFQSMYGALPQQQSPFTRKRSQTFPANENNMFSNFLETELYNVGRQSEKMLRKRHRWMSQLGWLGFEGDVKNLNLLDDWLMVRAISRWCALSSDPREYGYRAMLLYAISKVPYFSIKNTSSAKNESKSASLLKKLISLVDVSIEQGRPVSQHQIDSYAVDFQLSSTSSRPADAGQYSFRASGSKDQKYPCHAYNRQSGCQKNPCNFAHICKSCFSIDHERKSHSCRSKDCPHQQSQ